MLRDSNKILKIWFLSIFLLSSFSFSYAAIKSQRVFRTPEKAVDAFILACKKNSDKMMLNIFGYKYKVLFVETNKTQKKENRKKLFEMAQENVKLEKEKAGKIILIIGKNEWPFPIPIIRGKNGWFFDTKSSIHEIVARRIGENEIVAISVCQAYVTAQKEYIQEDRDQDEVLEYAQKISSTQGKKDGLYWNVDSQSKEIKSPLGDFVGKRKMYKKGHKKTGKPFYGYYFKILTRQGINAPGGKYDYIINDNMIGGFALLAYPQKYGKTGIMTFIVNQQGKIYEKNFGRNTPFIAEKIDEYNPDKTWRRVEIK